MDGAAFESGHDAISLFTVHPAMNISCRHSVTLPSFGDILGVLNIDAKGDRLAFSGDLLPLLIGELVMIFGVDRLSEFTGREVSADLLDLPEAEIDADTKASKIS